MLRVILILCAISRASLEMQMFQHQMYISRKSRSNTNPTQTTYVYSRISPGVTVFENSYRQTTEKATNIRTEGNVGKNNEVIKPNITAESLPPQQNDENVKAKTKYPGLGGKETMDKHLKSLLHYTPIASNVKETFKPYEADQEFRLDDEDLRSDSIHNYNGWPYSYYGPFEYQIKDGDSRKAKAKDKRFLIGAETSDIPVNEHLSDSFPSSSVWPITTSVYFEGATTDNPIYGNQPFFSFVLNDYFDRNNDEYPLVFKDFTWAEEFDHSLPYQDARRSRRLDYNYYPKKQQEVKKDFSNEKSVTEKGYDSNREYTHNKRNNEMNGHKTLGYGHKGHGQIGFKDFLDSFANKFGTDNHNKHSMFTLKQDQDKGENRKGFRRVYHKDEYQEDKEFYDNTNKKAHAEENGGSNINLGQSQAILQSHAVAAAGNVANSSKITEDGEDKKFRNNNDASESRKRYDNGLNYYRNVAKDAAVSNIADYMD